MVTKGRKVGEEISGNSKFTDTHYYIENGYDNKDLWYSTGTDGNL